MLRSPSRPAPALSQPGHGPAPTTEETPALLLGRPSGGLWMQRGRLVSEDHCTPMAPRVCRKPGPQPVVVPSGACPGSFAARPRTSPNDRRDAGTAAQAPFRRSLDATRSPGLRRPLHADGPRQGLPRLFRGQATDQPNDRRDAGTAARAPFRRSLDATRSPGLRRPLHADGPACLPQAPVEACPGSFAARPRTSPNDRRDAGTAARAPFRRSLDATRSPGLRRPLHADGSGLASERVCQGSDLSPFQRPK